MSKFLGPLLSGKKDKEWIPFQKKYNFDDRQQEFIRIKKSFPGKIPVIVEPSEKEPKIDRHKYLISPDILIGQFLFSIRNRIELKAEESLFFFVNNKLPILSETMGSIYEKEKHKDGFIYMKFAKENTFGN